MPFLELNGVSKGYPGNTGMSRVLSNINLEIEEGDIRLTEAGKRFARGELEERKKLFAQHLVAYVPLAGHIKRVLDERASHRAPASRFRDELEDHMAEEQAERTLRAVISWARYAEVFAYDEESGVFSLDNPS